MHNYTPKVSTVFQKIAKVLLQLWFFSLGKCKSMLTPDQQLHSMFLQFTSSTWKSTCTVASDKMHPNTKYSNYPATASTPVKQA